MSVNLCHQPCRDHFPLHTQAAQVPFFVPFSPHSAKKQGEKNKNEFNALSTSVAWSVQCVFVQDGNLCVKRFP